MGPGWRWYGSHADEEDHAVARVCSDTCQAETTVAEMEQLVRRRRDMAGTDDLTPLRDHRRTDTAPAEPLQTALF